MLNKKNILGYFIILLFSACSVSAAQQNENKKIYLAYYFNDENEASQFLNNNEKIKDVFKQGGDDLDNVIMCEVTAKEYAEIESNNNSVDVVKKGITKILHQRGLDQNIEIDLLQDSKNKKQIYQKDYERNYENGVIGDGEGQVAFGEKWNDDTEMPIRLKVRESRFYLVSTFDKEKSALEPFESINLGENGEIILGGKGTDEKKKRLVCSITTKEYDVYSEQISAIDKNSKEAVQNTINNILYSRGFGKKYQVKIKNEYKNGVFKNNTQDKQSGTLEFGNSWGNVDDASKLQIEIIEKKIEKKKKIHLSVYFENDKQALQFLNTNKNEINSIFKQGGDNAEEILHWPITEEEYGKIENNTIDGVTKRITEILESKKLDKSVKIELLQSNQNQEKELYEQSSKKRRGYKRNYVNGVFGDSKNQVTFEPGWSDDNEIPIRLIIPEEQFRNNKEVLADSEKDSKPRFFLVSTFDEQEKALELYEMIESKSGGFKLGGSNGKIRDLLVSPITKEEYDNYSKQISAIDKNSKEAVQKTINNILYSRGFNPKYQVKIKNEYKNGVFKNNNQDKQSGTLEFANSWDSDASKLQIEIIEKKIEKKKKIHLSVYFENDKQALQFLNTNKNEINSIFKQGGDNAEEILHWPITEEEYGKIGNNTIGGVTKRITEILQDKKLDRSVRIELLQNKKNKQKWIYEDQYKRNYSPKVFGNEDGQVKFAEGWSNDNEIPIRLKIAKPRFYLVSTFDKEKSALEPFESINLGENGEIVLGGKGTDEKKKRLVCSITTKEYDVYSEQISAIDKNSKEAVQNTINNILYSRGFDKNYQITIKDEYRNGVFKRNDQSQASGTLEFRNSWGSDADASKLQIEIIKKEDIGEEKEEDIDNSTSDDDPENTGWEKVGKAAIVVVVVGTIGFVVYKIFVERYVVKQGNKKKAKKGKKRRKK